MIIEGQEKGIFGRTGVTSNLKRQINMNTKSKKILAREILCLILGTILFFILFFGYHYFHEKNKKSSEKLENEIEKITNDLPARQLLWLELSENNFFEDSYDEFQLKYNNEENQEFLYHLLKNNDFFTGSFSDFRVKYFQKDMATDDAYELYKEVKGWISKDEFNSLLKDQSVIDFLYKLFVECGYRHSKTDFKNLISGTEDKPLTVKEIRRRYKSINELKQELEKKKLSVFSTKYYNEFWKIALILFSILFILRYLIYVIKWSFKQMKE